MRIPSIVSIGERLYALSLSSILSSRLEDGNVGVFEFSSTASNTLSYMQKLLDGNIYGEYIPVTVVFTGGEDVDPQSYGHIRSKYSKYRTLRDEVETLVFDFCIKNKIPMVGICRGSQFLWVKMGGTLIQHMPKHKSISHNVLNLAEYYDFGEYTVNSYHHQSADPESTPEDVVITSIASPPSGPPYVINARTKDIKLPEVESWYGTRDGIPIMGVQWHPEVIDCPKPGKSFFRALVDFSVFNWLEGMGKI